MTQCAAEMCPYWTGHGCVSGAMPCDDAIRADIDWQTGDDDV